MRRQLSGFIRTDMIQALNNIFYLSGRRYTYAMCVNEAGYLQHAYYGKKVSFADVEYYVGSIGSRYEPKKENINADTKFDEMPSEYGFYAHGDFREPSVIVERGDGAAMSRLRYVKHEIYNGAPEIKGMPHVRGNGQTLSVTVKDDFSATEITLDYTVYDDSDVLVRGAKITNTGKEEIVLKKAFSFSVDLDEGEYRLLRLCGNWAAERAPVISPIGQGITRLQSLRGASSHQTNPFAAVLGADCTEESGECYGAQLMYSGSFAITAEKSFNGSVRLQGGVNDTNFAWELGAGDCFTAPQAFLCYSSKGLGELSRQYADFLREHVINPQYVYKCRPIVVNNWEATYFNFDEQKLSAIIDEAARLGIDTFVLDDGWFGVRNDDTSGLGDWFVNEKKLRGGLQAIIDRCKQNGMKFGLWFEPEGINENSDLYRAHHDWAIGCNGVEPCRHRNQLVLDFSRKEVVDYIYSTISKILTEYDISYVKWDFNRSITENYSRSTAKQGGFSHKYILGVYDLAERLTSAFPEVFFEGCAGGGGRFDAGMLYYFPQIWTSDNTDAYNRAKIQWGTSLCYPVSGMSCHVSACPNHWTNRITPLNTRGVVASLGAFGYELDLTKLTNEEKEIIQEQIRQYKQTDELVLLGDLYRICNPFADGYFCEMLVGKDKSRAYVAGMCLRADPYANNRVIRLRGLDENKIYTVRELGLSASGAALMQMGLITSSVQEYHAWQWNITEKK